jgi:hypothetical protein
MRVFVDIPIELRRIIVLASKNLTEAIATKSGIRSGAIDVEWRRWI